MADFSARTNGTAPGNDTVNRQEKRETAGGIAAGITRSLAIYTHASRDAFILGLKMEKVC